MTVEGYEDFAMNSTTTPNLLSHSSQSFTAGMISPTLLMLRAGYRL